jgi:hypothetical protein
MIPVQAYQILESLLFRDWDRIGALGVLEPELKKGKEAPSLLWPFLVVGIQNRYTYDISCTAVRVQDYPICYLKGP